MILLRKYARLLPLAGIMLAAGHAQAADKDTLVYCMESVPESFNPQQATSGPSLIASSQVMFNRLITLDLNNNRVLPSLATAWEISPDGKTYTFTLRKGVKFNSNKYFTPSRDFNADDVVFSILRQKDASNPYHAISGTDYSYFNDTGLNTLITAVKKLDDGRVQFTLSEPNAAFLADMAMDFTSILSAEYAGEMLKKGTPQYVDSWPVGTGPYALRQYKVDTQIRYLANPHYWGGPVPTRQLVFSITPDIETRLSKLRANECQIIPAPSPAQLAAIEADPNLTLHSYNLSNVGYLAFNTRKKPFDNVLVRQALNYATDKKAIVRAVFNDKGTVAKSFIPAGLLGYDADLPDYGYDVEKAKALLRQAGVKEGTEVALWSMPVQRPYNPNSRRIAEMIQSDWARVGIKAKITTFEWGEYLAGIHRGEHDAALYGWLTDNGDPDNFAQALLSCNSIKSGSNIARWCDSGYDKLVRQGRLVTDRAARLALYKQAQEIFYQQAPWIPIANGKTFYATRSNVSGFNRELMGTDFSKAKID